VTQHARKLSVALDVVYNTRPDGNYLGEYGPIYRPLSHALGERL